MFAGLAGVGETVGGLLFAAGFATPLAAALIVATMINAYAGHAGKGVWAQNGGWEYALVLGAVAVALALTGSGAWSLDAALRLRAVERRLDRWRLRRRLAGGGVILLARPGLPHRSDDRHAENGSRRPRLRPAARPTEPAPSRMENVSMRDFTLVNTYAVPMARFIDDWNPAPEELARLTDRRSIAFWVCWRRRATPTSSSCRTIPTPTTAPAADPADRRLAWTVAHNIVHATASGEEYAAVAADLARGVDFHGRPRFETPWQSVTTVEQCRRRLEESRRIRLASLRMWPIGPT